MSLNTSFDNRLWAMSSSIWLYAVEMDEYIKLKDKHYYQLRFIKLPNQDFVRVWQKKHNKFKNSMKENSNTRSKGHITAYMLQNMIEWV